MRQNCEISLKLETKLTLIHKIFPILGEFKTAYRMYGHTGQGKIGPYRDNRAINDAKFGGNMFTQNSPHFS